MELSQLEYFVTIAKLEHMTKAAEVLHISQPSLSRSLKTLEQELELPLFHRVGRRIILNDNGKILYRHAEIILKELKDAYNELSISKDVINQNVSLSVSAGSSFLPDIINGFRTHYPNIILHILQQNALQTSIEDCDITISSSIEPARCINSITLMEEEIYLALPKTHPLTKKDTLTLEEIAAEPFISLYQGSSLRNIMDKYCEMSGFSPKIILECDNPNTVRELISLGLGLAFVPQISWANVLTNSELVLRRINSPNCIRYINMSWRNNKYPSSASHCLRNYLIGFFDNIKHTMHNFKGKS